MKRVMLLLLLLLAGCGESLDRQNRLKTFGASHPPEWPAAGEALAPPPGTVSRAALAQEQGIATPPPVTSALLERGKARYEIYCAPCHGLTGAGDGIVVAHGFPRPAAFGAPNQMRLQAVQMMNAIGHGTGRMYAFAGRVAPADRWAIVAYIRALQLAARPRGGPA